MSNPNAGIPAPDFPSSIRSEAIANFHRVTVACRVKHVGRMGRLWQSLSLAAWHGGFAWLPVESLISERQAQYYAALGESDRLADSAPFVEFMLAAIRDAMVRIPQNDQVRSLIRGFGKDREMAASGLMERLDLRHRATFRKNYLNPALALGLIEMTDPGSPKSPAQRYRLTERGRSLKSLKR